MEESQLHIIDSLGGIDKIISVFSTHQNLKQHYDDETFEKINQLLQDRSVTDQTQSQQPSDIDTDVSKVDMTRVHVQQQLKQTSNSHVHTTNNNIQNIITNIPSTPTNELSSLSSHEINQITLTTVKQYDDTHLILDVDMEDNFYFRHFTRARAEKIMYKILFSKWFVTTMAISSVLLRGVASLVSDKVLSEVVELPSPLIVIFCGVGYLGAVNATMFELIKQTFDFWFKMLNIVVLVVSDIVLTVDQNERYPGFEFFESVNAFSRLVFFCCFAVLDGIPLSLKLKRFFIVVYLIYAAVFIFVNYFSRPDFVVNPFATEYSDIRFKYLFLSSYGNLSLFVGKPIWMSVFAWMKRKRRIWKNNGKDTHAAIRSYEQLYCVYKRSYLKWTKPDPDGWTAGNGINSPQLAKSVSFGA